MFNESKIDLPIVEVLEELRNKLRSETTLIVNAPPGAGKSTVLPLSLLQESWLKGKKILMLEPRRLAAKTIANRMADLLGEEAGETVGYRIRFENKVSKSTKLEVVTEGILTRMLHSDNALEDVGIIIFDEFHERSIHADVALALSRECQSVLRPDLRIVIMSATLNTPELMRLLDASAIVSKGRQYPVDIIYSGDTDEYLLPELTAKTVIEAVIENKEGDTLVFLPGQWEITKCEEILKRKLPNFIISPLYGMLPQAKQYRAIMPDKNGRRKIVLATSIAETSLTIKQIKIVVDSGFGRKQKFDPRSGLSRLETVFIDNDSADQRAGRAGRLSAGKCYRMWSTTSQHRIQAHRTPEILEADLCSLTLDLYSWGVPNPEQLTWLNPPPRGNIEQAKEILHEIGAIEEDKLTLHGKSIHALACHPRIAHMLIKAEEEGIADLACDLAAILEERDPLTKEAGADINKRIEALRRERKENRLSKKMLRINKVASSYCRMLNIESNDEAFDPFETGLLLVHAFPERIAASRPGNNAQFQMANGKYAFIGHKDDLAHEPWLAVASVDARDGLGKIFLASQLNPTDLQSQLKSREVLEWNSKTGGLKAQQNLCIGSIILKSTPIQQPSQDSIVNAISSAIKKEGAHLLNFDDEISQWQNRVSSLKIWQPGMKMPDVSTEKLLETNKVWLAPYLTNIKTPTDLKKLNLLEILQHHLQYEQQQQLDQFCPRKIQVPSGSYIKLNYQEDGSSPLLSVRIQELFGLQDTPKVNNGSTNVLVSLLSPGFKPIQLTSDLASFWNNTYFEVRKELKRRYPKHHWPDDPINEKAIKGVKRNS